MLENKIIGDRIRTARMLSKLTLKDLAKEINTSYTTLSRIEKGIKPVTIEQLIKICEHTNKPLNYFIQEGNNAIEYFYPPVYRVK